MKNASSTSTSFPRTSSPRVPSPRRPKRGERGFTLVELMVAATAGLAIGVAVFTLSKNSMKVFQHEARISGAHLAATLGMNRLTADLQRASYMASPNILDDTRFCGAIPVQFDGSNANTFVLQGLRIYPGGSAAAAPQSTNARNGLSPDAVEIVGNFAVAEQYDAVLNDGGPGNPVTVTLQTDTGAMVRTLNRASQGGGSIAEIFRAGRMLRIVDKFGRHSYGIITNINVGPPVVITVGAAPALPMAVNEKDCGIESPGVGTVVNPVARIRYDLQDMSGDATYGPLVAPPTLAADTMTMAGYAGRTELVRREVDVLGATVAGTTSLVAEFAVDLEFGITVACGTNPPPAAGTACNQDLNAVPADPSPEPSLVRTPIDHASLVPAFLDPTSGAAQKAQRITGVQVRLSTRAPAPDRKYRLEDESQNQIGNAALGRRGRFYIPGIPGDTGPFSEVLNYARMRTLVSDVNLPNQGETRW